MATYKVKAYGKEYTVEVLEQASGARIVVEGHSIEIEPVAPGSAPGSRAENPGRPAKPAAPRKAASGRGAVVAPIPGVITEVCVTVGEEVEAGQTVVKLEAMKMENEIAALASGVVKKIAVDKGTEVSDGQLLVLVE